MAGAFLSSWYCIGPHSGPCEGIYDWVKEVDPTASLLDWFSWPQTSSQLLVSLASCPPSTALCLSYCQAWQLLSCETVRLGATQSDSRSSGICSQFLACQLSSQWSVQGSDQWSCSHSCPWWPQSRVCDEPAPTVIATFLRRSYLAASFAWPKTWVLSSWISCGLHLRGVAHVHAPLDSQATSQLW